MTYACNSVLSIDELAHIETFVAVADARSFTAAAQDLGIPQPLVSRRVKALERSWGAPLFERAGREVRLTGLAELVLPMARDVVGHAHHLRGAVSRAREAVVHAVAVPGGCPPTALAAVITAGAARGVALTVREGTPEDRARGLAQGRDAAGLVRVDGDRAPLWVAIGLAGADGPAVADPVHLDALRPTRGSPRRSSSIRLTPEDDLEPFAAKDFAEAIAGIAQDARHPGAA